MLHQSIVHNVKKIRKLYTQYVEKRGLHMFIMEIFRNLPKILQHFICKSLKWIRGFLPSCWMYINYLLCFMIDICRCFSGIFVARNVEKCKKPKKPLHLYEFEGCPFCRKVREVLSILAIDFVEYPCPKETIAKQGFCEKSRFRPHVKNSSGSLMFPYLEDPNTGVNMHESDDIIEYLWNRYGEEASKPFNLVLLQKYPRLQRLSFILASFCRPMMECGILRIESHAPKQPLEVWGFEGNFMARRVRELLCCLELPYLMHTTPLGSGKYCEIVAKKNEVEELGMKTKVFKLMKDIVYQILAFFKIKSFFTLYDPNTGVLTSNPNDAFTYLEEVYKNGEVSDENWLQFSRPSQRDDATDASVSSPDSQDD